MPTPAVLNGTYQYQCPFRGHQAIRAYFCRLRAAKRHWPLLQQPASEASRRLTKSNRASRTNNLPAYLKTKLKENTGDSELATHPCR
ncbi:hypothetical protein COCOBI_12-4780 [Coccomyxa sp. Obi]|nr:hypothetical protein COCOBI_12-4780 [Coccomyxa sp. Obi]